MKLKKKVIERTLSVGDLVKDATGKISIAISQEHRGTNEYGLMDLSGKIFVYGHDRIQDVFVSGAYEILAKNNDIVLEY